MTDVIANIPDFGTPIITADGRISEIWWRFFLQLFNRTGGTSGSDPTGLQGQITENSANIQAQISINAMEQASKAFLDSLGAQLIQVAQRRPELDALGAMLSPVMQRRPEPYTEYVAAHGLQDDPALHALVTTTLNGFMSAADKAKLDGMSYAEGTWTPVLTFANPGNQNIVYSAREGFYTKTGRMVTLTFRILTSTFTWTTASGSLLISGVPFSPAIQAQVSGTLSFEGLTKASYTQIVPVLVTASPSINLLACGSGVARLTVDQTFTTSGTNIFLSGTLIYFI